MNRKEAEEAIQKMIEGSKEADRMRAEISQIVGMLSSAISRVYRLGHTGAAKRSSFIKGKFYWCIVQKRKNLAIYFMGDLNKSDLEPKTIFTPTRVIELYYVKTVYESLPDLVVWINELVPGSIKNLRRLFSFS